ncbi:MAG: hypothetical protein QXH26_01460 [Candidatus Hadarchaeales archaeon]
MAELVSLLGLGISIIAAQLITTRSTQSILRSNQEILEEIRILARQNQKILSDMALCLRKIDIGMRANALMHGWARVDGISPEEARRLPEPKVYDEKLQICYYKPS